jgi:hypothetical protein
MRYNVTKSRLVENLLYLDGKPVSLRNYPWAYDIYDRNAAEMVIKSGRQCSKSTMASNFIISESIARSHWRTLYVSPSENQTSKFSATRLSKTLAYSPLVRRNFCGYGSTSNVFLKIMSNGSEIALSYAQDDADRIRGISADRIFLDEAQDMDVISLLPIIKECSANSSYGFALYTGTPKTSDNSLQWLYDQSTQSEWVMPCDGCGLSNYIDSVRSLGLKGIICVKCGHALNARNGSWVDLKPGAKMKGYHISQPILPLNSEVPSRWARILEKMDMYSQSAFLNEVLGISDALGTRLIGLADLQALCDPNLVPDASFQNKDKSKYKFIAAGVDWTGGSGNSNAMSRTSCTVAGLTHDNKFKVLHHKIFPAGTAPIEEVRQVTAIIQKFGPKLVMCDAGGGAVANSLLGESLPANVMFQVQLGALAKPLRWNQQDRYIADKTTLIDTFMLAVKRGEWVFPAERYCKVMFDDVLSEFEEVSENSNRKLWRRSPLLPDDSLFSLGFVMYALKTLDGCFDVY